MSIFYKTTKNNNIKNEIKLTLDIKTEDINNKIYFLDNTNREFEINGTTQFHRHDFLKELNDSNVELYINDININIKNISNQIKKEYIKYY